MEPNDSILDTIKSTIGYADIPDFDAELIININAALATLVQVGCGKPLVVKGSDQTWTEFMDPQLPKFNVDIFEMCKTYVHLRTKQLFDPPPPNTAGYYDKIAEEYLWRIHEENTVNTYVPMMEEVKNEYDEYI